MAKVDQHTLKNLKKLCRIDCTPEEEAEILFSLNRVLEYVHLLSELDTSNVLCCNFVLKGFLKSVMRDDVPELLLSRDQFLSNVPDHVSGLVKVPPVLKP